MKWILLTLVFYGAQSVYAQSARVDFYKIEEEVRPIETLSPDSLAHALASPYSTDYEKVWAIFRWITMHISYNVGTNNYFRNYRSRSYTPDPSDTVRQDISGTEAVARMVLKRKVAVCDGYTKLFKTLCDYAGIPCEIIYGYARGDKKIVSKWFNCNHSWNAVYVDSAWHLVDVTWASGYVTFGNEFVQEYDNGYFFSRPDQFIKDHFPDDLRWALLDHAPVIDEFNLTPYKSKSFVKYQISSFFPFHGIIDAAVGDTIELKLVAGPKKNIAQDAFFDSTIITSSPNSTFVKPSAKSAGSVMFYTFVVDSPALEWLNLLYNDEPVMRYRLRIRAR